MSSGRLFEVATDPITEGVSLVEASAGTGKTYSLVGLVLRALLEGHVENIEQMLVVTFTKAATAELTTRIRTAISTVVAAHDAGEVPEDALLATLLERHGDEGVRRLRSALRDFDRISVSTIHSFCNRVLTETAFESGMDYNVQFVDDENVLYEQAANDFWRSRLYSLDEAVTAWLVEDGVTPKSLISDYRLWRRHRDTRLLPAAAELTDVVAAISAAVDRIGAAWDRERVGAFLDSLSFKQTEDSGKPCMLQPASIEIATNAMDALSAGSRALSTAARWFTTRAIEEGQAKKTRLDPPYEDPFIAACDALNEIARSLAHAVRAAFIGDVHSRLERLKQESATLTQDDLIRRLREALAEPAREEAIRRAVSARYRIAFIDEFQDTDQDQYTIFRRLFGGKPVWLIGDPKQAIYSFRGADVHAYLAARDDAVATYTLRHNRRSAASLIDAVNRVFEQRDDVFVDRSIGFETAEPGEDPVEPLITEGTGGGPPPLCWMWLGEPNRENGVRTAVNATVDRIVELLDGDIRIARKSADGPTSARIEPHDIAVLVGRHNDGQAVREALAAAGIPAVQRATGSIFESDEMIELARLATAIANPADTARVKAGLSTRLWGLGPQELKDLDENEVRWQSGMETLYELRELWERRGFMQMIGELEARREVRKRLSAHEDSDRRLTNFRHAVELLHQAELEHHLAPDGLLRWLRQERPGDDRGSSSEEAQLRIEREANSVEIVTVHSSKGLQYEIVFCPFAWSGKGVNAKEPLLRHIDHTRVEMHCRADEEPGFVSAATDERMAEQVRLLYVALTRARRACYIGVGAIGRDKNYNPLAWTLGGPSPYDEEQKAFDLESAINNLVAKNPQLMELFDATGLDPESIRRSDRREDETPTLHARVFPDAARQQLAPWRIASFSGLTHGAGSKRSSRGSNAERFAADAETPDHLDPARDATATLHSATPQSGTGPGRSESIFGFARGARAGTCLHEILENVDLAEVSATPGSDTDTTVRRILERHGLDTGARHPGASDDIGYDPAAAVHSMIERVARAPVPVDQFKLADADHRMDEWQFFIPMERLNPAELAEVFRKHGGAGIAGRYAEALATLEENTLRGYLVGFVDAVICHADRWWIIDWKSNYLGDTAEDYEPSRLDPVMIDAHYVLQYHLYVLGLHRFLALRQKDYDYDRHFGGALYVFLRGIGYSDEAGWFRDRPSRALVEAMDSLFKGAGAVDAAGARA